MLESIQHKLDRVRPPRVQITYDVEIGGAIVMKELPFVMGIMADLSGMPVDPLPRMKYRKFVEIDRDNFNEIMGKIQPRLAIRVDNKIENAGHMSSELTFNAMDDFNPLNVVQQIEPLRKLYEARTKLRDMLTRLDGNDVLDDLLQRIMTDPSQLAGIQKELGIETDPNKKVSKERIGDEDTGVLKTGFVKTSSGGTEPGEVAIAKSEIVKKQHPKEGSEKSKTKKTESEMIGGGKMGAQKPRTPK